MKKLFGSILVGASLVLSVCGLAACDLIDINWGTNNEKDHVHYFEKVYEKNGLEAPTCTEDAILWDHLYCTKCHNYYLVDSTTGFYSYTDPVDENMVIKKALGHKWGEAETTLEPTCTTPGKTQHTCERCGVTKSGADIAPLGHSYEGKNAEVVEKASCLTPEISYYLCDNGCGTHSEEFESAPANGHKFTDVTPAVVANCVEGGHLAYKQCEVCGLHFGEDAETNSTEGTEHVEDFNTEIDSTNHKGPAKHFDKVEPTCETTGTKDHWECEACHKGFADEQFQEAYEPSDLVIDKLGHILEYIDALAPKCDAKGTFGNVYQCQRENCGKFFKDDKAQIPADEYTIKELEHYYPTWWGDIDALFDFYNVEKDAETVALLKAQFEENFGKYWNKDYAGTPAIAITEGTTVEPTCENTGSQEVFCNLCREDWTDELPALGHLWEATFNWTWNEYPALPTVTVTLTCSVAGCEKTKTVPADLVEIVEADEEPYCDGPFTIKYRAELTVDDYRLEDASQVYGYKAGKKTFEEEKAHTYDPLPHEWNDELECDNCGEKMEFTVNFYDGETLLYTWTVKAKETLGQNEKAVDGKLPVLADKNNGLDQFKGWLYGEAIIDETFTAYNKGAEKNTINLYAKFVFANCVDIEELPFDYNVDLAANDNIQITFEEIRVGYYVDDSEQKIVNIGTMGIFVTVAGETLTYNRTDLTRSWTGKNVKNGKDASLSAALARDSVKLVILIKVAGTEKTGYTITVEYQFTAYGLQGEAEVKGTLTYTLKVTKLSGSFSLTKVDTEIFTTENDPLATLEHYRHEHTYKGGECTECEKADPNYEAPKADDDATANS